MQYNFIKTHAEDHIFYLTLARPGKRNAFTPTMVNEIHHALQSADRDPQIRLVIIRAEGPVFCAGMDLKAFMDPSKDSPNPNIENKDVSLAQAFREFNKPTIALAEGNVIAGAFLIILECTYVFAKKEVLFSLPEVKLGIFPMQVLASLLKLMPWNKAMHLCITGEAFDVKTAIKYGIVHDFYEPEKIEKLTETIIQNAPLGIYKGFEALRALENTPEDKQFDYLLEMLAELRKTEDAKEGITALFEKRLPLWKNQ